MANIAIKNAPKCSRRSCPNTEQDYHPSIQGTAVADCTKCGHQEAFDHALGSNPDAADLIKAHVEARNAGETRRW